KTDFGTLKVQTGHRVSGRVVLSDGKPVPPDTRIVLGREDAWDNREALLDSEGRFDFIGVPAESVGMSVRIKGYKLSKRNGSLDWYNGGMVGRVEADIPDLIILLEPGEWRYNGDEGEPPSGENQPSDKPLRGAKL
ncbi:MAG TPA: carboxypeptidase-like regulatory domain-containing protein, partial [Verrucomicrobiae bacterium]|nr:carboxypeptidase-like regulatory domain-containing protein [Verrucomicrobiae bacterium]